MLQFTCQECLLKRNSALLSHLHATSYQRLEAETAWEQGQVSCLLLFPPLLWQLSCIMIIMVCTGCHWEWTAVLIKYILFSKFPVCIVTFNYMLQYFNLNLFLPNDCIWCCETFSFIISLPTMSWELIFCMSEQKGLDRGRWVSAPEGCKQGGCVWAHLYKGLGWHWKGHFFCPFWH